VDQTATTFQEALKPLFQNKGEIEDGVYKDYPYLALVPKTEDYYGDGDWKIAVKYKRITGRSVTFARAQANKKPSKRKRFTVTRERDYALAGLTTEVILASKNNPQSLADALKEELDDAMEQIMLSTAKKILRDGTGTIGQISSGSNVATATITLANVEDIVNFEVEDVLTFSSAPGSGARTGSAVISGLDRDAGTITFSAALNSTVTSVAASDYIQVDGDFGDGLMGIDGWVPYTAPTSTPFFGIDRTVDLTRLSGIRLNGQGRAIEEAYVRLMTRVCREGGRPQFGGCNPARWEELEISLGSQRQYVDVEVGTFGFQALKLLSPKGPVAIMSDPFFQPDLIRVWNNEKHEFKSLTGFPILLDADTLKLARVSNDDANELRVGYFGNYGVLNPVHFGVSKVSTS
jgi:hypothetical protein